MSSSLGVVDFNSYGRGLANLQEIYKNGQLEVLEIIPVCGGLTLILSGSSEQMAKIIKDLPHEDRDHLAIIEKYDPQILRALYSLDSSPVLGHLLVLEGEFAGDLLEQAARAIESDLSIVDLKVPRGASRTGFLLLTHEQEKNLVSFRTAIGDGLTRVTLIRGVADQFKKYFDLAPKA